MTSRGTKVVLLGKEFSLDQLAVVMRKCCAADTSFDSAGWTTDNPWWGHCLVVSLLVQDICGGDLIRQSLKGVPGYEHFGTHYSNRLPDGAYVDFTVGQLRGLLLDTAKEVRSRESGFKDPDTVRDRYDRFKERLFAALAETEHWKG